MRPQWRIDERVGCIAIVDATKFASPGLGPDYPGVVWFRHGRPVTWLDRLLGRAGQHECWLVPRSARRAAERALAALEAAP